MQADSHKPNPVGRPTSYTPEIGDLICEAVSRKQALASFCDARDDLPCPRTVYRWLREHKEFSQNYTRAKEDQADYLAEDVLTVSDDMSIPSDHKRIMTDARKWIAGKLRPKKYGEKLVQEIGGSLVLTALTDDEINAKLVALLAKQVTDVDSPEPDSES